MRARFGLSPPERRIGLSAHDFVQGASAPIVYLTRAEKIGGAPTLPSRWLLRLDAVLGDRAVPAAPHLHWASAIDAAAYEKPDETGPQPIPSLDARPRQLSVTQIETWMRDPYELYAKKILGFRPLDALDEEPGASDRGNFIHDTLDRFLKENPAPDQAFERLLALGREEFGAMLDRPLVQAFWWPRFEQIARWFLEQQEKRAGIATPVATEHTGTLVVDGLPEGDFVLTAKADRIDQLAGGYEIIDYKTGRVPTGRQLLAGYAAQMPLEAAMLMQGAFPGIEPSAVDDLSWWVLKGSADKNESALKFKEIDSIDDLAADALVGLRRLVSAFDDPKTPYLSRPDPTEKGFGDFDHLARIKEWGA
jgi:ATP-dependent helicase/nuclease subunit B